MFGATFFTVSSFMFVAKIAIVSSGNCTQITETSGAIRNENVASVYTKCWRINVPQNSQVHVNMEYFATTIGDCRTSNVEISHDYNEGETFVLCPTPSYWDPLILKGNFTVTHHMYSAFDFLRSEFSLKYKIEYLGSEAIGMKCDDNGDCFVESLKCEEFKQCSNGTNEEECVNRTLIDPDLTESRVNGIQWLKNKWPYTRGWQENVHRGITALFLARDKWNLHVEEKLMLKELEVQTLVYILRKKNDKLTVNQLSMFVNALTVSCQNPRSFYGHDLVKLLKDEVENSTNITHSVAYLALCNAGQTLPVNVTNDLNNILKKNAKYSFLLDIQAITVMALSCLKVNYGKGPNTSFPQTDYEEAIRKFKELQLDDGSFGNIYTTAVVTQALLSAGQKNCKDWNYNKAVSYLIRYLNSETDDFLAMYLILPILNGKCLSSIKNANCSAFVQRDPASDMKAKLGPKIRVQYSLNIGDEKDIVHTISFRVPQNITVFEVMQLAQDADAKYKFQKTQIGEKLYIYDIAGVTNDFEDGKFWFLYVGEDAESVIHTNESSDKITLQDGAHLVMWYKKANI